MFFFGQTSTQPITGLSDSELQKLIFQAIQSANPNNLDAKIFLILPVTAALSVYLSTVSRDVAKSINKDFYGGRVNSIPSKRRFLLGLIVGDLFLWMILLSVLIKISIWLFAQPTKQIPLDWMIILGIPLAGIALLILHVWQWIYQIRRAFSKPIRQASDLDLSILDFAAAVQARTWSRRDETLIDLGHCQDINVLVMMMITGSTNNKQELLTIDTGEIASRLKLSEIEVQSSIDSLIKLGFISASAQMPNTYLVHRRLTEKVKG